MWMVVGVVGVVVVGSGGATGGLGGGLVGGTANTRGGAPLAFEAALGARYAGTR